MTNTTALAQRNQTQLSQEVQKTAVDPEIIALASAFYTAGEMSKEQAVKAAYFFYQTGHVEGRDDYIGTTGGVRGKVLEGYRGVQREVGRDYEVKYRRPTVEEVEEHGIDPKGKALVCEVYVLDIWQRKQRMGLPYEPVIGIAYYPPGVKINVPATKTEHWVLQKNARKDALRQVPGVPLDADEVFAEAAATGVTVDVPEGARPSADQARLMVAQAQQDDQPAGGPDWAAIEGEFTEEAAADFHAENNDEPPLPFRMTLQGATEWAMRYAPQVWPTNADGTIVAARVENSFKALKRDTGLSGDELALAWIAKVDDKVVTFKASQASDGWAEVDAAGHGADEPLFS